MVSVLIQENSSWMKEGGGREKTRESEQEGKACRHQRKYHSEKLASTERGKERVKEKGR